MNVKAKGLDHVAIAVKDLEKAIAHYRDAPSGSSWPRSRRCPSSRCAPPSSATAWGGWS